MRSSSSWNAGGWPAVFPLDASRDRSAIAAAWKGGQRMRVLACAVAQPDSPTSSRAHFTASGPYRERM